MAMGGEGSVSGGREFILKVVGGQCLWRLSKRPKFNVQVHSEALVESPLQEVQTAPAVR